MELLGQPIQRRLPRMGLGQTLVVVKTYSLWASLFAHMAKGDVGRVVGEHSQLEGRLKETEDALKLCQEERDSLKQDSHQWDSEKTRLEGKVSGLNEEKKKLSESLGVAEAEAKNLDKQVKELTVEVAIEFDRGFETALAQLQVLYPEVDVSKFDLDKIFVDGQIAEQVAAGNHGSLSVPVPGAQCDTLNLTALDHLLNDEPDPRPNQQTELVADYEATP